MIKHEYDQWLKSTGIPPTFSIIYCTINISLRETNDELCACLPLTINYNNIVLARCLIEFFPLLFRLLYILCECVIHRFYLGRVKCNSRKKGNLYRTVPPNCARELFPSRDIYTCACLWLIHLCNFSLFSSGCAWRLLWKIVRVIDAFRSNYTWA